MSSSKCDHAYINEAMKCSSISIIENGELKGSNEFICKYIIFFFFKLNL